MPPKKSSKEPEPTDRATRSRTKPDKPQPKYTYSDEEATSHARMTPAETATVYATSSYKRDQKNDRSRSNQRSESKFGPCYRCGKTSHEQQNCYYKDKTCLNCDRTGHIAPVCKQPRRRDNSSGNANRVGAVVDSPPGGWLG